ncbi:MAG: Maf family nucleotide pyrophosphatase [bacterium]
MSQKGREPIILASASERRRKILENLGIAFEVVVTDVDEVAYASDPRRTAAENALLKSDWCRMKFPARTSIAADTVIDFMGRVVGKPATIKEASEVLALFSGKSHTVITAVAFSVMGSAPELKLVESQVLFKELTGEQIRDYCSRVNPLDKAGGYDIDQFGALIIESSSGSRTNIMGLPAELVEEWVVRHNYS